MGRNNRNLEGVKDQIIAQMPEFLERFRELSGHGEEQLRTNGDEKMFALIAEVVKTIDEPVNFDLCGESSLEEQVMSILQAVSTGKLTPKQGHAVMDLIYRGREVVEFVEIREKMEMLADALRGQKQLDF